MAINKFMLMVLKAISYANDGIKKNYKIERKLIRLVHPSFVPPYKISEHKISREGYDIPIRIFTPDNYMFNDILLFFHGGGWVVGDINSYTNVCANMAEKTGCRVMSVDYRLAPEFPFPCGLEDCYAVAKELYCGGFDETLVDIGNITLVGESAGGNLAAALSIMANDRKEFSVKQQILFYPALYYDHTPSSPYKSVIENGTNYLLTSKKICDYMDLYMPDKSKRNTPYFAPLVKEDLSNQPRTLIITAQYDPLRDEGEAYEKKLVCAGCDAEVYRMHNALHGFLSLPSKFLHVKKSYEVVNEFLKGAEKN